MVIWIAFFRGINVGGNNSLPMKDVVTLLGKMGCSDVKTYIQSGNVLFKSSETDSAKLAEKIGKAILAQQGFQPQILLLSIAELKQAAVANPFPQAEAEPKSLHLFFLAEKPGKPNLDKLNQLKIASEAFDFSGTVFYLHAPEGIGRSKLAASAEKLIGVPATARNWRTVTKMLELAATFE